ncbi:MAG: AAA family ATPase [Thermodesulfobacteriota bacterium]|nr:AAA family ATPase [Thermodesulfobacteriota bacterium]
MDYFSILNLKKEPFSNSPDPKFFFQSRQHLDCLQKLELALRLRRGLNVIIGDVGTGKTTLCRQLIRRFASDEEIETHLILDPFFSDTSEFLSTVYKMLKGYKPVKGSNDWQIKESIKQYLFRKGVDEKKTVILIIDEGQKIPVFCLEILREFLNYETNEYKLLQIVIFAQKEFEKTIDVHDNFADRINLYHFLKPLGFNDTRLMIKFRLEQSIDQNRTYTFFTRPALWAICWATGGYPRKIINLCHRCIMTMIIQNRSIVNFFLVRSCIQRVFPNRVKKIKIAVATAGTAVIIVAALFSFAELNLFKFPVFLKSESNETQVSLPGNRKIAGLTNPQRFAGSENRKVSAGSEEPLKDRQLNKDNRTKSSDMDTAEYIKPQTPGEALLEKSSQLSINNGFPEILGKIKLRPNQTLSGLIQTIYGSYNSKHFKSLILANPYIDDPDIVDIGQTVALPAIPANLEPLPQKVWWIKIADRNNLEEAFNILETFPDNEPPIRLIPYWNSRKGIKFAVVLKKYFLNEKTARLQLERLPLSISSKGKIISSWDVDNVFFADPFLAIVSQK